MGFENFPRVEEMPKTPKKESMVCERCSGYHSTENCEIVKHEAEFRAEDLALMTEICDEVEKACNVELDRPDGGAMRDRELVRFKTSEVLPDMSGGLRGRVTSKLGSRDFYSVAAKFIAAYPDTEEAKRMRGLVSRVEGILK